MKGGQTEANKKPFKNVATLFANVRSKGLSNRFGTTLKKKEKPVPVVPSTQMILKQIENRGNSKENKKQQNTFEHR